MQRYEIFLNLPNFLEEIFKKKNKWATFHNVTHLTKNLTIQIMENKERYYKRKTSIVPYIVSKQSTLKRYTCCLQVVWPSSKGLYVLHLSPIPS